MLLCLLLYKILDHTKYKLKESPKIERQIIYSTEVHLMRIFPKEQFPALFWYKLCRRVLNYLTFLANQGGNNL